MLDLRGNPEDTPETKTSFIRLCPKIELYNDEDISTRDKMDILGFLTEEMKQYEE